MALSTFQALLFVHSLHLVWQLKTTLSFRGFNMVEILVALALLSFGLYGAADLIASARHTSSLTQKRMQATALAQLKLQELKCAANAGSAIFPNGSKYGTLPSNGNEVFEQNTKYGWNAEFKPSNTDPGRIDIVVQVGLAGDTSSSSTLAQVQGLLFLNPVGTVSAKQ